jgi:hypothetical protein
VHYQGFLENPDKNKLRSLHEQNQKLHLLLDQFVEWYYDPAQPRRTHDLLEAAALLDSVSAAAIVTALVFKVFNGQQCFDAIRMFNKFWSQNYPLFALPDVEMNTSAMLEAPDTVLHIFTTLMRMGLQPFLHFRNHGFNEMTLGVQQEQVVCSTYFTGEEQVWNAYVNSHTPLTATISFEGKRLDVSTAYDGVLKLTSKGTNRTIQADDDDHYVKILSENGKKKKTCLLFFEIS